MVAEGDRVVLQWTSRARTRGGREYENGCIGVFTIRDGRIQAVREYMDTLYAGRVAFADEPAALTCASSSQVAAGCSGCGWSRCSSGRVIRSPR